MPLCIQVLVPLIRSRGIYCRVSRQLLASVLSQFFAPPSAIRPLAFIATELSLSLFAKILQPVQILTVDHCRRVQIREKTQRGVSRKQFIRTSRGMGMVWVGGVDRAGRCVGVCIITYVQIAGGACTEWVSSWWRKPPEIL